MFVWVIKMLHSTKESNVKNRLYHLFISGMINIKNYNPNLLGKEKLSYESASINISHVKYMTIKSFDHVNINSENPLSPIFNNTYGYIIEVSNENNYLVFASTHNHKEVLKIYKRRITF